MEQFILTFCRSLIGIVFLLSSVSKLRDMTEFKHTIQSFQILPDWLVKLFSWLFVGCELIVVIFIVLGGIWLGFGFALAALLLSVFSVALISVLIRKIQTSCNCFGSSKQLITPYDVIRNIVFISFALGGWQLYSNDYSNLINPNLWEFSLIGLTALAFVLIVINLNEIAQVFK